MSDRKLDQGCVVDPSWKSASQLGVSPTEYAAMIAVREAFIKGEIQHVEIKGRMLGLGQRRIVDADPSCKMFNLAWDVFDDKACGTSYCIGGWMFQVMHPGASERATEAYVKAGRSEALHDLFWGYRGDMKQVDELEAAQAIGRVLSGKPAW